MKSTAVRIYVRIRRSDGTRLFALPVFAAHGRLRPQFALVGMGSRSTVQTAYTACATSKKPAAKPVPLFERRSKRALNGGTAETSDKQLGPYQGCPGLRRVGAALKLFPRQF